MWNINYLKTIKYKNLFSILLAMMFLISSSCSNKLKYGLYKYIDPFISEFLTINPDSSFSFEFFISSISDSISGTYVKQGDTLIFNGDNMYTPKIEIEHMNKFTKLVFKDHNNESLPGVSCHIKLSNGRKLNVMSDFDGSVILDTKKRFYLECSFPGFRSIKKHIDITEYSKIAIRLEIANSGEGMREFVNERYVIKRNKLIRVEDSVSHRYKFTGGIFR